MQQRAFIAVDECDFRVAGRRRCEAGIVCECAGFLVEGGDVDHAGSDRPVVYGKLMLPTRQ